MCRLLSCLVIVACLSGCSVSTEDIDLVKPDTVHQSYTVAYNVSTNTASLSARFRFGDSWGTNLRLVKGAKVQVNGAPLREVNLLGVHYSLDERGVQPEYVFEFTTPEGATYTNRVALREVHWAERTPTEWSRGQEMIIPFQGPPVQSGEEVFLEVIQQSANKPAVIEKFAVAFGANQLVLDGKQLRAYQDGEATIHWVRDRSAKVQEGTSRGGEIRAYWSSGTRKVVIVP